MPGAIDAPVFFAGGPTAALSTAASVGSDIGTATSTESRARKPSALGLVQATRPAQKAVNGPLLSLSTGPSKRSIVMSGAEAGSSSTIDKHQGSLLNLKPSFTSNITVLKPSFTSSVTEALGFGEMVRI